ncbi:MAG: SRPBCC family protein [Actinomycetota bacterium]|nr:SRPBCC family protein [Actinomycetota bacterium]
MPQRVEGSIEIEAPVGTVYEYWETLENLPNFMANVEEVRSTGPDTTYWKVKGPFGRMLEWEAQTTQREQNQAIAWNSTEGEVGTSGQVRFQEVGQNRTRVEVQMNYANPPGGKVGEVASRAVANPKLQLEQDLRNLKEIMEGRSTPEEVQQQPAATTVQSGVAAFLTSGTGLLLVGASVLLVWLLLRRRGRGLSARGKRRVILEI